MILRPLSNFTGNGVLKGTIAALDDLGDPLGWESFGNWSDRTFLEKSSKQLAQATGIDLDRARISLTRAVQKARRLVGIPGGENDAPVAQHKLPVVVTSNRYLRDLSEECWRLLKTANGQHAQFFQFGDTLCDLTSTEQGVQPRILSRTSLRNRLDRLGDFVRVDQHGDENPSRPPKDLLEDMLDQANPPLALIQGIVRGPVCRPDGSVITIEGYDPATGLFLAMGDLRVPPVTDSPSNFDLSRARALLLEELLGDFPFVSAADQATPSVRSSPR